MQDSSVLSEVDLFALEHGISKLLQPSLLCNGHQDLERLLCEEVLREVEQDLGAIRSVVEHVRKFLESGRILLELILQNEGFSDCVVMGLQSGPTGQGGCLGHLAGHVGSPDLCDVLC